MARRRLVLLVVIYVIGSAAAGSMRLDQDEFSFVREPYELLGGDYTVGYARSGEYAGALATALKAYYFFWKYRPLFSPVVADEDKTIFGAEEKRFGYVNPAEADPVEKTEASYRKRLIVPEPDRFYTHGAGRPLLPAIVNIPPLALVALATRNGPDLLSYQYQYNYHPIFILVRLSAIFAGLATLVLVYLIAERAWGQTHATLAGALFLAYPPVLLFFPNIHHDAYMVPFLLGAVWGVAKERYVLAGISYGLALAAKNVAILLAPAIVAFLLWKLWSGRRSRERSGTDPTVGQTAQGLLVMGALSVVTLLPFAHPVSYAQEILTPLSEREYDRRGEDVGKFMLVGRQGPDAVGLLQRLIPWNAFLAFVLLGILVCGPRLRDPTVALCFFFLLMMFPHSTVFGQGLTYRSLSFVPFFCLAAVRLSNVRWCVPAIAVLALLDLVWLIDPITIRGTALAVPDQTLMKMLFR